MSASVADDMIRSYFDRWQRLEEEKRTISNDLKELFAEARGNGLDTKALRAVFREQVGDKAAIEEFDAICDLYRASLNAPRAGRARESQSYAEAKGRDAGSSSGRTAEFDSANAGSNPAPVTSGELTDTQEQPETSPADEIPAGSHGQCHELVAGPEDRQHMSPVTADAVASVSEPLSPSPANTPRLAADDEAAQANPTSSAPISNPQPTSSPGADEAGGVPTPPSPASQFDNPRCKSPDGCTFAHSRNSCFDCTMAWATRPRDEQRKLWQDAIAASETEAA